MKKYKLYESLGDGTYGIVFKGLNTETGERVAIKKLKTKIKTWQECLELNEVKALSKLKNHHNIIKLKEVIRDSNSDVYLIFEYAECNLFQYIEKMKIMKQNIPESKIKKISYQILNGLSYIHLNGYFHRDLKPENILITDELFIKIADFGLAKEIPNYYNNNSLTDYVCTRWYRAPECVLRSTHYTSSMDVWSVGVIIAELYNLNPLFPGFSEIDQLIKIVNILGTPKFNDWPEGYKLIQKRGVKFPNCNSVELCTIINASEEGIELMRDILSYDPLKRPQCGKLLTYSYFDEINGKKLNDYRRHASVINENLYSGNKYIENFSYLNQYSNNIYKKNENFSNNFLSNFDSKYSYYNNGTSNMNQDYNIASMNNLNTLANQKLIKNDFFQIKNNNYPNQSVFNNFPSLAHYK